MTTSSESATTATTHSAGGLGRVDLPATKWFRDQRRISAATLAQLPVASGTAYFPELNEKRPAIFFKYSEGWKARTYPDKYFVASGEKTGGSLKREFWNLDRVLKANPATVYIAEGETDVCALVEAGIPIDTVLGAHGGKDKPTDGDPRELAGYAYVLEALEQGLKRAKRIVWCGDGDGPGLLLREDMVKIFGAARFYFVEWPEGIKDANQMLITDGAEALGELVRDGTLPWPVEGLFRLSELPEPSPMVLWEPGFPEWERKVMLAPRTLSVVTGHPGHGKAFCVNTAIPTPDGWVTMGNLQVGDKIFDETGEICRVTFATPVMYEHDCFRVVFDDGSEIIADGDHNWFTETEAARQSERAWKRRGSRDFILPHGTVQSQNRTLPSVVTTREIAKTLMINGKRNHAVRLCDPINLPPKDLPIPPYTLGVWLGDGDSNSAQITKSVRDIEVLEHIGADGVPVRKLASCSGGGSERWSLTDGRFNRSSLTGKLRSLGLLKNKHIPAIYLRSSIEQRLALLQGLMDTDGHSSNRAAEFSTIREVLANGVYELVCSLGVRARIDTGRATLYGKDCGPKYRVRFSTSLPVFRLKRKADANSHIVGRRKYRYIVSCDPSPSVPVRCIQVDSPSHLFLCGKSFIPTHNTALWNQIWFNVVKTYCIPFCGASFETRPKPHVRRQLRSLYCGGLERDLQPEEIDAADRWINERYIWLVHPDNRPTLEWILDKAEVSVIRHGARILQIDPWNRMEAQRTPGETVEEYIARCLRTLYQFATDLNCHVQILAHPAKMDGHRKGTAPLLEDIAGAKHWDNMADQGFTVHRPKLFEGGVVKTEVQLFHRKARFEELGHPCKLNLNYDRAHGKYKSVDYEIV